jgi:hypothetical protein
MIPPPVELVDEAAALEEEAVLSSNSKVGVNAYRKNKKSEQASFKYWLV